MAQHKNWLQIVTGDTWDSVDKAQITFLYSVLNVNNIDIKNNSG